MGITNNKAVYELFNHQVLYDTDLNKLFDSSLNFIKKHEHLKVLKKLMKDVYLNHTYLNILGSIFWHFRKIKKNDIFPNFKQVIKHFYE